MLCTSGANSLGIHALTFSALPNYLRPEGSVALVRLICPICIQCICVLMNDVVYS